MTLVTPRRYDVSDDVRMRLESTYIRYKDQSYYVIGVENLSVLLRRPGMQQDFLKIHSSDEDLDISSHPVGWVNTDSHSYYCVRMPARRQKQGLSHDNSILTRFDMGKEGVSLAALHSRCVFDMLDENYPSYHQCLEMLLNKKIKSQAFSRKLAIGYIGDVLLLKYKNQSLGFYDKELKMVCINPSKLNTYIVEDLIRTQVEFN